MASDVRTGILIGGKSTRMGRPKSLLTWRGRPILTGIVDTLSAVSPPVLLGMGPVPDTHRHLPRLADAPNLAGPAAGLVAALDAAPGPWIVCACDMPFVSGDALAWLIEHRDGVDAVLPVADKRVQPLLALYDSGARALLRALPAEDPSPRRIAGHESVRTPLVPDRLTGAWRNINTPEELE